MSYRIEYKQTDGWEPIDDQAYPTEQEAKDAAYDFREDQYDLTLITWPTRLVELA